MNVPLAELQQRLGFIDRTIVHARRACRSDDNIPQELRTCLERLGYSASQIRTALLDLDERQVRRHLDELVRVSDEAQECIRPADGMNYDLRSAVILAHIELSALRSQLN